MYKIFQHKDDKCHDIYKTIFQNPLNAEDRHLSYIRDKLNKMWPTFEPYADTQFETDFRLQPDQRYWEMYLGCCLVEQGFNIKSADRGPDFAININDTKIWVEAVTASAGNESSRDKVPKLAQGGGAQFVPREKLILRYRTVLDSKVKKYREYVSKGLVKKNDIKVIAVSRGGLKHWPDGDRLPYIMSAIFPIGQEYVTLDKSSDEIVGGGTLYQDSVTKENGKKVETEFFTNPDYSDISAIIYSRSHIDTLCEENGTDIIVIHNPLAERPLPKNTFNFQDEYWLEEYNGSWRLRSKNNLN